MGKKAGDEEPSCLVHARSSPITPKRTRKPLAWGWNLLWAHNLVNLKLPDPADQQRFFQNSKLAMEIPRSLAGEE